MKQKPIIGKDGEIYGTPIWHELMPGVFFAEANRDMAKKLNQQIIRAKLPDPPHSPENPMKK